MSLQGGKRIVRNGPHVAINNERGVEVQIRSSIMELREMTEICKQYELVWANIVTPIYDQVI